MFFCFWVVISRNNLPCGYLVLPGLAGTQEDVGSTGEGSVERRLNRLVFSKGLEMVEAQISGKVQINIYLFSNKFVGLAEQEHISGTNPDCCQNLMILKVSQFLYLSKESDGERNFIIFLSSLCKQ